MFSGCSVKMQCEDAVCGCIQVIMPWWVCVVAVQGWSSVSVSGVLVSGIIMRLYLYQHDYSLVSSVLYTYPLFSQILLHTTHKYVMELVVKQVGAESTTIIRLPKTTLIAITCYQNVKVRVYLPRVGVAHSEVE